MPVNSRPHQLLVGFPACLENFGFANHYHCVRQFLKIIFLYVPIFLALSLENRTICSHRKTALRKWCLLWTLKEKELVMEGVEATLSRKKDVSKGLQVGRLCIFKEWMQIVSWLPLKVLDKASRERSCRIGHCIWSKFTEDHLYLYLTTIIKLLYKIRSTYIGTSHNLNRLYPFLLYINGMMKSEQLLAFYHPNWGTYWKK